jgi:ferrous iron transport protein B
MGAVYRETNAGWTAFIGVWTTGLAYWSAVIFYQGATFQRHPRSSAAWVVGLVMVAVAAMISLHWAGPAKRKRSMLLEG